MKKNISLYMPAIIISILLIIMSIYSLILHSKQLNYNQRKIVQEKLSTIKNKLQSNINNNIFLIKGLVATIASNPQISKNDFHKIAQHIYAESSHLKNIAIAPNLKIKYIYPVKGNEAALGLDYTKKPKQLPSVLEAKETKKIIVAGPVKLIQGGTGFIARTPVYLDDQFWGIISTVIDAEITYKESDLYSSDDLKIAIAGRDGKSQSNEVFFGDSTVFTNSPEIQYVNLPNGSWRIAAITQKDWQKLPLDRIHFLIILILLTFSVFSFYINTLFIKNYQELKKAKSNAEEASAAKSTFLSSMSHELRTPLNAILGFSELLETEILEPKQSSMIQDINKAGKHLLSLIQDILDLSKIETGNIELDIQKIHLNSLIKDCIKLNHSLSSAKNVQIDFSADESYIINADPVKSKQAIINILSNAIKYNEVNGSVTIQVKIIETQIQISITDTGIGIPKEELEYIFQPFHRTKSVVKQYEGTGIGLTISKHLIEEMNGKIEVSSVLEKGTTFRIYLPGEVSEYDKESQGTTTKLVSTSPIKINSDETVLYVEDNILNQKLVEKLFEKYSNVKLVIASTGTEGIELAKKIKPKLILLDIHLPDMSGLDVLDTLKEDKEFANTNYVAVSANAMSHDIQTGMDRGLDDYIVKPIKSSDFTQKIAKYI